MVPGRFFADYMVVLGQDEGDFKGSVENGRGVW